MRLSENHRQIIISTVKEKLGTDRIFLFGSRADDGKKGGDIDLFVRSSREISLQEKLETLAQLEKKGILRKVDLIIETPLVRHKKMSDEVGKNGVPLC